MAITAKQLTNRVLRSLRQTEIGPQVSALNDDYQILIWQFVNKARQEIEQAHKWRALRQNIEPVSVTAGGNTADITGTNEHSLLMYDLRGRPMVFDITNSTNVYQMREASLSQVRLWNQTDQGQQADQPSWCNIDADEDTLILRVWPVPSTDRQYSIDCFVPQGELDHLLEDDLDTNILVPARPVELLALAYALEERGEELGTKGDLAFSRAERAIGDAIAQDYQAQATLNGPGQYDMQVV